MSGVELFSVLTCPRCGHAKRELMPSDACQFFYACEACHALLRPQPGDCCVFCSFGNVKCPPMQLQTAGAACGCPSSAPPGTASKAKETHFGLGRKSRELLHQAGIFEPEQLRHIGAVQAYVRVMRAGCKPRATLNKPPISTTPSSALRHVEA